LDTTRRFRDTRRQKDARREDRPMQPRPRQVVNCPHCGAVNPAHAARCEACTKGLVVYIGPAQRLPRRFGLGSLMVLVASVAVGLSLIRPAPPLGVLVLALVPPALVRTMAAMSQRAGDERPMSTDERVSTFFASLGVMLGVLVGTTLAFAVVAMPAGALAMGGGGTSQMVAVALSACAAVGVASWLLRKLWPYRG
jgi:hypothetical protein